MMGDVGLEVLSFTFSALCPPPGVPLLLLRVHALVPPQVAHGAAGVVALGAAVGFLPGVGAQVALQVDELRRGIGADGAAVRLAAIVDGHVTLQVVGVTRGEGAQRAGEQPAGGATPPDGSGGGAPLLTGETVKLHPQSQTHTWRKTAERVGQKISFVKILT